MAPTTKTAVDVPIQKLAVSYQRVSTKLQAIDARSGIDRQEQALQHWLVQHPDYVLDERFQDLGLSGAGKHKTGAFGRFLELGAAGRWPPGTCLVVESFSRFSREPLEDALLTLIQLWKLGLCISFCDWNGEILTSIDSGGGTPYQIIGAHGQARREFEAKRDRSLGASTKMRTELKDGLKPFKSRTSSKAPYPFWLDFDETTNKFQTNNHADWVKLAFELSETMGAVTVTRHLQERGVMQIKDPSKRISRATIDNLLRNPAVYGGRALYKKTEGTAYHIKTGEVIEGVYPPLITKEQFDAVHRAIELRAVRLASISTKCLSNLFQGRLFCSCCNSVITFSRTVAKAPDGSKNFYDYICCGTNRKDRKACTKARLRYREDILLGRLQDFRWSNYFNDDKQQLQLNQAIQNQLKVEANRADAKRKSKRLEDQLMEEFNKGNVNAGSVYERKLKDANDELAKAEKLVSAAQVQADLLRRKPTGADAAAAIQKQIADFLATDRSKVENRQAFNRWLHKQGIVCVIELETGRFELGTGTVAGNGELQELNQVMDDAALFGLDPALFAQHTHQ